MKKYYDKNNQVIYNCDNLELLKNLKDNSINLIYCDILYNSGKVFDDYSDNLGDALSAIEWYRPRIVEMKRVLKENGCIFLHCNWRLDSYIRILMDEIFTPTCFKNRIYRKHSNIRGFVRNFDSQVDVILNYVKNPKDYVFNEIKDDIQKVIPLFENGYFSERSDIIKVGSKIINFKDMNKHSLLTEKELIDLDKNGELMFIDGLPYRKTKVKTIGNLWCDDIFLDNYCRYKTSDTYDTPKPLSVVETILKACSNEGDTIADFFLGGGTTAVCAQKLNRKGIYCDISKKACDVTVEKLSKL